jgi:teichoic acid transport system permease protein
VALINTPLTPDKAAELAAQHNLQRIDITKSLPAYLRDVWRLRLFVRQYAVSRIIASTTENRLGLLWEFLNPLLTAAMYFVAFGLLLGTRGDSENFILFLISGVFTWHLFNGAFTSTAKSMTKNKELTKSLVFPRIIIPLASGLQAGIRSFPAILMIYPVALLTGETFRWIWLLLPFTMLFAILFGVGAGLLISRLLIRVPDIAQTIPIFLRLLFFTSGIFFSVEKRLEGAPETIAAIASNSPTALLLNFTRRIFLDEVNPSSTQLIAMIVVTGLLFIGGVVLFWRGEKQNG